MHWIYFLLKIRIKILKAENNSQLITTQKLKQNTVCTYLFIQLQAESYFCFYITTFTTQRENL